MAKIIKKKFFEIDIPIINEKYEAISDSLESLNDKTIKIDFTRKLRGKSVNLDFRIVLKDGKAAALPKKLVLMPYFIRHMIHTGVDYIEDSFKASTSESEVIIKPFLITRKKVSRAVRRTLRNSTKNWLVDYLKSKTDSEVFEDILSNQMQRPLGLKLKKIYPLAICEIRVFEVKNHIEGAKKEEKQVGEIEVKKEEIKTPEGEIKTERIVEVIGEKLNSEETAGALDKDKPKKRASKKKGE